MQRRHDRARRRRVRRPARCGHRCDPGRAAEHAPRARRCRRAGRVRRRCRRSRRHPGRSDQRRAQRARQRHPLQLAAPGTAAGRRRGRHRHDAEGPFPAGTRDRARRHGSGLPGPRRAQGRGPRPRPVHRGEGTQRRVPPASARADRAAARVAPRAAPGARPHRARLRLRQGRRHRLHDDGVRPGQRLAQPDRRPARQRPADGAGLAADRRHGPGAAARACRRHRAFGLQARQRDGRREHRRQSVRFRHRPCGQAGRRRCQRRPHPVRRHLARCDDAGLCQPGDAGRTRAGVRRRRLRIRLRGLRTARRTPSVRQADRCAGPRTGTAAGAAARPGPARQPRTAACAGLRRAPASGHGHAAGAVAPAHAPRALVASGWRRFAGARTGGGGGGRAASATATAAGRAGAGRACAGVGPAVRRRDPGRARAGGAGQRRAPASDPRPQRGARSLFARPARRLLATRAGAARLREHTAAVRIARALEAVLAAVGGASRRHPAAARSAAQRPGHAVEPGRRRGPVVRGPARQRRDADDAHPCARAGQRPGAATRTGTALRACA